MTQCGCASGSFISELESTVRVQPGISTSLEFPALAIINVASTFIIIWLCLVIKKNRSGATDEAKDADDKKTEEVNYAALTFGNKQRRTVQKRTNVEPTVIYGAVRHQEEL
ncbi:hypothetical protein AOLI_G00111470 [Acnodon oligacanthus]